jgi:DNA-binding IclR family transcriptional regulator
LARQPRSAASSKSLQKAIRILLHSGENGPDMSLSQFASALRLNKTTVHRLLRALQEFHLVERNPHSEKYRLGLKFHALGARSVLWRSLPYDARPFLVELSRRAGETAILAIPGDFIPAQDRFILVHARMKVDIVKNFAAKLSKLFSRGPADFATISPPYVS